MMAIASCSRSAQPGGRGNRLLIDGTRVRRYGDRSCVRKLHRPGYMASSHPSLERTAWRADCRSEKHSDDEGVDRVCVEHLGHDHGADD